MIMKYYETEIGKEVKKKFGKLKKGDIVRTYLNENKEILSCIRVNVNKYGVVKVDLKQFKDYDPNNNDLYVNEIIENLFDYTFDICTGEEVDHIDNTIIV
jgi:hypothetical protein